MTGALVTCHLSHPQYQRALLERARSYILHIKDLKEKLVVQLGLWFEQVVRFEGSIPTDINLKHYFNEESLMSLVKEYALVVPFDDQEVPYGFGYTLNSVLDFLVTELGNLYDQD